MYKLMPFTRRAVAAAAAFSSLAVAPTLRAQAACAVGEATVRAGDARLARFSPLPVDSMTMSLDREGQARQFGSYSQHVERANYGGRAALLFIQRGTSPRGVSLDSIWVDAHSWAPLRHYSTAPGNVIDLVYANGRATGRVTNGDTVRAVNDPLPEGTLEFSVVNTAVRAVPVCEGSVVRAAGYDPSTGKMREAVVRVLGGERVEIGGAPRDVWTTEVKLDDRTVQIRVDRGTGRELEWRMTGPNGGVMRGVSAIFTPR